MGQISDADHLVRTHIVNVPRPAPQEQGQQPVGQVVLVQVRAQRRAVPSHLNGVAGQGIADEIADGEVDIQRQVAPDEGETAGDDHFQTKGVLVQRGQVLRRALAQAVGIGRIAWIRTAGPVLAQGREIRRLGPIDPAGTDQQQAFGPDPDPEIKQVPGPGDDLPEALQGREPWA